MSDNYVALLGTKGGPAIRPGSTMPTSSLYVLNGQKIVVDCGLGVTKGLVDQDMQLKDLSLIIISHLHSDHYFEFPIRKDGASDAICECGHSYKACPTCSDGWLIERSGRYGKFLSCVKFPRCTGKSKV